MRKLYSWTGVGFKLHKCTLTEEAQEALEKDNMEAVLCFLIDTEQCRYRPAEEFDEYVADADLKDSGMWVYIDNTSSNIPEKANRYYVYTVGMKIEEIKTEKEANG